MTVARDPEEPGLPILLKVLGKRTLPSSESVSKTAIITTASPGVAKNSWAEEGKEGNAGSLRPKNLVRFLWREKGQGGGPWLEAAQPETEEGD